LLHELSLHSHPDLKIFLLVDIKLDINCYMLVHKIKHHVTILSEGSSFPAVKMPKKDFMCDLLVFKGKKYLTACGDFDVLTMAC